MNVNTSFKVIDNHVFSMEFNKLNLLTFLKDIKLIEFGWSLFNCANLFLTLFLLLLGLFEMLKYCFLAIKDWDVSNEILIINSIFFLEQQFDGYLVNSTCIKLKWPNLILESSYKKTPYWFFFLSLWNLSLLSLDYSLSWINLKGLFPPLSINF